MIKPKGLKEILAENPSLAQKITYEEYQNSIKSGFDDSSIEDAYKEYCDVKYKNNR